MRFLAATVAVSRRSARAPTGRFCPRRLPASRISEAIRRLARRYCDIAIEKSNRDSEALYFKVLERLVVNDREPAIAALQESLEMDPRYSRFVETDPDLQQLRDDERFQELLGRSQ
ncbi:MAG: TPR end-of-group domain-containing protein [Woeseiaceae bacterium]